MKDRKCVVLLALWLAWSLMACRSAVEDFYDPLTKAGHCGGAAGSTGGAGGGATGGQTGAAAGGNNTGGQGGECP